MPASNRSNEIGIKHQKIKNTKPSILCNELCAFSKNALSIIMQSNNAFLKSNQTIWLKGKWESADHFMLAVNFFPTPYGRSCGNKKLIKYFNQKSCIWKLQNHIQIDGRIQSKAHVCSMLTFPEAFGLTKLAWSSTKPFS